MNTVLPPALLLLAAFRAAGRAPTGKLIGWALAALVFVVCLFNAVVMAVSPRTWFALPEWISAKGTLRRQRYQRGSGPLQIRALGAITLAFVIYVLYTALKSL